MNLKISKVIQISIIISIILSVMSVYIYGFGIYEANNILGNFIYTIIYWLFYFFVVLFFVRFIAEYKLVKSIITFLIATIICAIIYFTSGDLLANPSIIYGESINSNFEAFVTNSNIIYIYIFSAMIFIILDLIKAKTMTSLNILMLVFALVQCLPKIIDVFYI